MSAPQDPGLGATVLTHPSFDREPVQNQRVPGRRKGAVSLSAARRKRLEREETSRRDAIRDQRISVSLRKQARLEHEAVLFANDPDRPAIEKAIAILGARLRVPGACFDSPSKVKTYLVMHLAERRREAFAVLFLDAASRLIAFEVMFEGTLTQAAVYPREVLRRALELDAAAVIFAHNHPSGSPEPSRADEALTAAVRDALAVVDVRTLDHIIVAGIETVSFLERGLL